MKSLTRGFFKTACIVFSITMLIMSLIYRVQIMNAEQQISALEKNIKLASTEAELLYVRLENRISLSEIEQRAINELGMRRPLAEQMFFEPMQ